MITLTGNQHHLLFRWSDATRASSGSAGGRRGLSNNGTTSGDSELKTAEFYRVTGRSDLGSQGTSERQKAEGVPAASHALRDHRGQTK